MMFAFVPTVPPPSSLLQLQLPHHSRSHRSGSSISQSSPSARHVLKPPVRPVALRNEYLTDVKTKLVVWPRGDDYSATSFEIKDEDGTPYFAASGRKFNGQGRSCREFRDASGLPLFELHWKPSFRSYWRVTLPGWNSNNNVNYCTSRNGGGGGDGFVAASGHCSSSSIAIGTKQRLIDEIGIKFENVAAAPSKTPHEKQLSLRVIRLGNALWTYDVVDGDRKIAQFVESIQHNNRLALRRSSRPGYRPVLDVVVVPGVDLSLVS